MSKLKYRFEQLSGQDVTKLYIYDDVTVCGKFNWSTLEFDESETSANYFREQLAGIPETGKIELHVNSNGGSVKEGVAIYNLLKQHKAEKVCFVDGFAYSIASVICMACDKITMGLGTSMLIHNMAMEVYGDAKTLRKCADDLDVLMESNRKIYMARAKNLTEDQLKEMMDAETFLTPEQCLEYGFCDEIADYQADQNQLNQLAANQIRKLRQKLTAQESLREEMKKFAKEQIRQSAPVGNTGGNNPGENGNEELCAGKQKTLKIMNAFLDAFQKGAK